MIVCANIGMGFLCFVIGFFMACVGAKKVNEEKIEQINKETKEKLNRVCDIMKSDKSMEEKSKELRKIANEDVIK